jgi:hypothetical protein
MGEKYAFSSMLHLVWAVVLVLGMGFVHFYMSMIATSFDPCPDEEIDANLKASIDKSNKYFNDIKMIHLGIAGAIILTMLIGKALVPKDGKTVCSIVTIVLKLAACLIVIFGVSHAQNILKIRNHQCKNKIDELKVRELKILIEACIGSIGVIIGNYLSLGINNLISFKMESSMSIIVTTVVCILLVVSIIGGDALINIFKKELNIKNECLALDEELSNANVQLGSVGGVFKDFMPNKLEALPTSKTIVNRITKDFNEGKTVMGGKPVITTIKKDSTISVDESYTPSTSPNIKIKFTEALTIPKDHSLRVTFPKEFKFASNGIIDTAATQVPYDVSGNTITLAGSEASIAKDYEYILSGITLPRVTGITQPIKLEIFKGTEEDPVSVSNNNFFDIKADDTITIDNSKNMSKIFVRTKGEHLGDNVMLKITSDGSTDDVRLPYFEGQKSINMKKDTGHSNTVGAEIKREEYNHYSIQRIGTTDTTKVKAASKGNAPSFSLGTETDGVFYYVEGEVLDGYSPVVGDLILLKDQATKTDNGVYKIVQKIAAVAAVAAKMKLTKDTATLDGVFIEIENGTLNKDKIFKKIGNDYKDEKENYVYSNIFKMIMVDANMTLEADKFYYFELPLELVESGKALKIESFKLEIGTISDKGVFEPEPDTTKDKESHGPYTLSGHKGLTSSTTEVIEQIACPVLSRDLFMKIFLTSVMTGWAVSSVVYLSGELYEYNSDNIALMMGGGGGTGEVVVNVTKPEA